MKFRAKLADVSCIQHFSRVVSTISRLSKSCAVRITLDKMYFIMSDSIINGGTAIWCELLQANFFNEFNMEGVNKEANEIYMELIPDNLVRCLKCAQSAKSIKIKLTKKQHPCLTLEVELPSMTGSSRLVTHDIPVSIIPRRQWTEYSEPESPEFDVSVFMPSLKVLRSVVDRMKNLSNFVSISAAEGCSSSKQGEGTTNGETGNGQMKLRVETDLVTITTHFKDLGRPQWQSSQPTEKQPGDALKFAEARVDIRKLAQFLTGQQVNPTKVICNIAESQMIHLLMIHDDVSLQFFMPCVSA